MKLPLLFLALPAISGLQGAPVASDQFESPNAEAAPQEVRSSLTWTAKSPNFVFSLVEDAGGLQSGKSLDIAMPFHYGGLYVPFPPVSLEPGQTLKAALRFRFSEPPQPNTNSLRFGFIEVKSDNPADGSAPGYWIMINPGSSESDASVFFESGTDPNLGGGQDLVMLGRSGTSSALGTTPHRLVLTVSLRDNRLEISWQLDEGEVQTRSDPELRVSTFSAFALGVGDMSKQHLLVDDFEITKE